MPWTIVQSNGHLWHGDPEPVATGYSGAEPDGKNNPAMQQVACVGPLPAGWYDIVGQPFDSPEHGPFCLRLQPRPETEMYGRTGMLIHGDSVEHPGCASEGCFCVSPITVRQRIWNSGDLAVQVVADDPEVTE
jgi:hypothetical protein